MKVSEINKLIRKHLERSLSDYSVHRDLIFKIESDFFIKGYDFESRGNEDMDLSVWCFVQPLFVKSDCLYYTFGGRLTYKRKINLLQSKEMDWWDARKENLDDSFQSILQSILKDGEKYLNSIASVEDFYKKFNSEKKDNLRIYESVAYSTILFAEEDLQNKLLKGLIKETENESIEWIRQIGEDATLLLNAETSSNRMEILKSWANETIAHLKLSQVKPFV